MSSEDLDHDSLIKSRDVADSDVGDECMEGPPLPADIQQPLIYLDADTLKLNERIEDRIRSLQKTMVSLKRELIEEKELWRKEVDEMINLQNNRSDCDCDTSLCITDTESETCCCVEPVVTDLTIMDYEKKLAKYQQALAKAQAEKRFQLRRHIAANTYRRRLLEVENMCNMELLRVKQSVQFLQPLQALASEWSLRHGNVADAGDSLRFTLENGQRILDKNLMLEGPIMYDHKPLTFPPLECIGSRMYSEMNEIAMKITKTTTINNCTETVTSEEGSTITLPPPKSAAVWYGPENQIYPTTNTVTSLP